MKRSLFALLLFSVLSVLPGLAQPEGFEAIRWKKEKLARGLVLKSAHTILYDTLRENINVLCVNTRKRSISLHYNHERNEKLSSQVAGTGAIAAVNGGFFNIREGGSVTYIRKGGLIAEKDTSVLWTRNSNMTGAVLIDRKGKVLIDSARTNDWYDSNTKYEDVLVSGPLLLLGRKVQALPSTSLVSVRHPRTAIGRTGRNRIVLLTLDGRTKESRGLNLEELTGLMLALKCSDALNLDGGGSTTMFVAGKPFNGIVNMPCDNRLFDHEGERAVSDILIVR